MWSEQHVYQDRTWKHTHIARTHSQKYTADTELAADQQPTHSPLWHITRIIISSCEIRIAVCSHSNKKITSHPLIPRKYGKASFRLSQARKAESPRPSSPDTRLQRMRKLRIKYTWQYYLSKQGSESLCITHSNKTSTEKSYAVDLDNSQHAIHKQMISIQIDNYICRPVELYA